MSWNERFSRYGVGSTQAASDTRIRADKCMNYFIYVISTAFEYIVFGFISQVLSMYGCLSSLNIGSYESLKSRRPTDVRCYVRTSGTILFCEIKYDGFGVKFPFYFNKVFRYWGSDMLRCEFQAKVLAAFQVVSSHTQRRHHVRGVFVACGTDAQIFVNSRNL